VVRGIKAPKIGKMFELRDIAGCYAEFFAIFMPFDRTIIAP
jgi:hypothetical protein